MSTDKKTPPKVPRHLLMVPKVVAAAGGAGVVAKHFDISIQAIYQWNKNGIPSDRARDMEMLTRGRFTRYQMCPAVFGRKPEGRA